MGLRGGAASTADIQNFCASLKPKARDGLLTVPLPERVDRVIVKSAAALYVDIALCFASTGVAISKPPYRTI